jgi:hypothetical protein
MSRNPVSKRNAIAISLVLLALAATILALKPRAAQANEETPFKGTLTVQVVLIPTIAGCGPSDVSCITCVGNSSIYVDAQGIGDSSMGAMFGEILKCFNPTAGSFGTYAGTLTTTAPNRKDSLTWAYSGQNDNAGDFYGFGPFSGALTVTGGTGKFDGASGSATFTAVGGPASPGPNANSLVSMAFYLVHGSLELHGNN